MFDFKFLQDFESLFDEVKISFGFVHELSILILQRSVSLQTGDFSGTDMKEFSN